MIKERGNPVKDYLAGGLAAPDEDFEPDGINSARKL
jgi:hypothetical protein